MAWGLEARVPFLDKKFLEVAMNVDAKYKMFSKGSAQKVDEDGKPMMEKVSARDNFPRWLLAKGSRQYIIRKAFDCAPDGKAYLPDSILWRQKEQVRYPSQQITYDADSSMQFSDGVGYSWIDGSIHFHGIFRPQLIY